MGVNFRAHLNETSSESLLNQSLELSKHTVFGFFFFPFLFFHSPFSYKILRAEIA